jgi:adhesin transport system membrane fusion protein
MEKMYGTFAKWLHPETNNIAYMSSVSEALLLTSPNRSRRLFYMTTTIFLLLIIWASIAEVDEFTLGQGKVVPSQDIQLIQNLEGGIVAEILVSEGELVEKNQVLMRLDDTRFSSSMKENSLNLDFLKLKVERLKAEATGAIFEPEVQSAFADAEVELYQRHQQELAQQQAILTSQLEQKLLALSELKSRLQTTTANQKLTLKEYKYTKPLVIKGAVSEVEVIRLQRSVNDINSEVKATRIGIQRTIAEIDELESKKTGLLLSFQAEAQAELNQLQAEVAQLTESSLALDDRVERTLIRAPVKGRIKQVNANTIGGVVQPGVDVMQIVPFEDQLMVEVQVSPKDIADIHPEQSALVKVTAYDFSIHGGLQGKVVHISPDSITNEKGESFYLVKIKTHSRSLQNTGSDMQIIPGMTVEAGIQNGKKTIMAYLLKPILKTKQNALRER